MVTPYYRQFGKVITKENGMKMDPRISSFFPLLHRENITFLLVYFLLKILKYEC